MSTVQPGSGVDIIAFGPFQLHVVQGRLLRDGEELDLQPLVLDLLRFGAQRPGQLISRDVLRTELWPDVRVTDHSLTQLVFKLRSALGEHRHFWKTVPKRGFRFEAPVRTSARRAAPPALLGRAEPLDALDRLVGFGRLVTIVGPGGIGKTTLARAFCEPRARSWFVDLSSARTAVDLCSVVADTLGIELARGREPAALRLRRALAAVGEGTLVLDNLEQLGATAAEVVGSWSELPLALVGTSREPVGVSDEQILPLGPLSPTASSELLLRRVRRFDPQAAAGLSEAGVAQLVEALDGIPLALELAAPHLSVQSAETLAAALPARLELLASPDAPRPARHHTLRGTFDLSWRSLPAWGRHAMVQLATFRGSFTAELAEALLELPSAAPPPLRALAILRRTSWLERDADPDRVRLRLLHPIRAYVRTSEEAHEAGVRAMERHARVVLEQLPPLHALLSAGVSEGAQLASVRTELRAIVDRDLPPEDRGLAAVATAQIAEREGMYEEALSVLERGGDEVSDPDLLATIWLVQSRVSQGGVGVHAAQSLAERALQRATDPRVVAYARLRLADIAVRRGDLDDADANLAPLLAAGLTDRTGINARLVSSRVGRRRGQPTRDTLVEALASSADHPDLQWSIRAELSAVMLDAGDQEEGIRLMGEARDGASAVGMRVAHTGLSLNLSGLLWSANRRVEALDMMAVALDAARTLGDRALHGHAALRNANALADEGRADEAWPLYDEAYTAMREVSKTGGENVELCRGISLFAVGDLPRAQAVLERVKANSLRMGDPPNGWRADLVLASVALVDASYGEAERLADQALGAMGDHSGQQAEALALRGIARMLRGRKDDGMDDLGSAHAAIGSDRGRGWWCWRVFDGLARGMDLTRMGQVLKQTQPDRWVRALHAWALGLDGDLLRD